MTYRATDEALRAECSALRQELKAFEHLATAATLLGDRVRVRHRWLFLSVGVVLGGALGGAGVYELQRRQRTVSTLAQDHGDVFGDDLVDEAVAYSIPFAGDVAILSGERDDGGLRLLLAGVPEQAAIHIARSHPLVAVADVRRPVVGQATTLVLRFIDGASPQVRVAADYGVLRILVSRRP